MYCYVQVTSLRLEPFVLLLGDEVNVIARAKNAFGWSEYSQWNLETPQTPVRIQTPPRFWPEITFLIETSTLTSLDLVWAAPSHIYNSDEDFFLATGGAEIIGYELQIEDIENAGTWISLVGGSELFNQTQHLVEGLTPNTVYTFRARA